MKICLISFVFASFLSERASGFLSPTPKGNAHFSQVSSSGSENEETSSFIQITESDFGGAGQPCPDLQPEDIPSLLMEALVYNDFPDVDSGIKSMWAFSSDTTKHIFQNNLTEFVESAHDTANTWPTSFYGAAMYGNNWAMESPLNRVGGENGWIATQVMKTRSSDGRMRRWQWELRKNKRPPNLGCWFVETIGSSDRKGKFEAD